MALSQKLEMRQGQALVMTPQLQQAIKLLQMSNVELQAYVATELERNPLLEPEEASLPAPAAAAAAGEGSGTDSLTAGETAAGEAEAEVTAAPALAGDGGLAADPGWASLRGKGAGPQSDGLDTGSQIAREETLQEHLTSQLNLAIAEPADRMIGAYLIGSLDERGYLAAETAAIAETLGCSEADVARVLARMQGFEPAGVFARDLKECLAIQLKERNRFDPAMQVLIAHLDLLARRDFVQLQRLCGVDFDDIRDMAGEIRSLNPKPGSGFGSLVVQPVVPDVHVRAAPDGNWLVELNSETLPRVLVNNQYHARVSRGRTREEDRVFLNECLSNATWLVKSLDQRARTILKVAREIVRLQDGFLVEGVAGLRPLNLKTVAAQIGMHESTVSRVTSNKYMATPRGTFEMKYFFTTAIPATAAGLAGAVPAGEGHSAEAVRHRIRALIEAETAANVLSDDSLVEALRGEGIEIARRTVAKYRESLGIASSVQRRREKRAFG